jgi:acetyl-CoA decarbonylase/synthase complex subunit gamma
MFEVVSWLLIIPAVAAYLAMNFTGCSTYTSLSGVKREMRWALPLEIGLAGCGMLAWITSRVFL